MLDSRTTHPMADRYRSGWWLELKYHDEGWTQAEMAAECDVSPRTIRKYVDEYDIETRDVEGENHGLYGVEREDEVRERISETLEGREFDAETRERISEAHRGRTLPDEVRAKISDSLEGPERPKETREKMSRARLGPKNPQWRGGHRGSDEGYGYNWTVARREVNERDEVCQNCGRDGSERLLDVHHIIPVRVFKQASNAAVEDAHDLENLVLLCRPCHAKAGYGDLSFDSGIDRPD